MNWYYVEAGGQAGPVDDAGLKALVVSGKVRPETLVWREGMANWQAYREVQPAASGAPPTLTAAGSAAGAEAVCAECGGMFPLNDTIKIGDARVCANCKPVFVQKLREGVPQSFAGSATATEEQILGREYRIDIGSAVSRGWATFTNNAGLMISTLLLAGLAFLVFLMISMVMATMIPGINNVVSIFFTMPLFAGMFWFSLRLVRGEPAAVSDGFAGFKTHYVRLIGYGAIQFAINLICALPLVIVLVGAGMTALLLRPGQPVAASLGIMSSGVLLGLLGAGFVTVCLLAYVNTLLTYVLLLIMDKNYPIWPAMQLSVKMVRRRWWMTFAFLLVGFLVYLLGAIMCLVGLFATAPLYLNMKSVLYNDNFRDLAPRG
jgi:uncharacterized membrane protein